MGHYAISYRTDVRDPSKYNAVYAVPTDEHWRIGRDIFGEIAKYDTPAEAEASAGHRLVALLRSTERGLAD